MEKTGISFMAQNCNESLFFMEFWKVEGAISGTPGSRSKKIQHIIIPTDNTTRLEHMYS